MVKEINQITNDSGKHMLIYLSMAFGNPYGEIWNEEIVKEEQLRNIEEGLNKVLDLSESSGVELDELIEILKILKEERDE